MPLTLQPRLIESACCGGEPLEHLIAAVWPEAYRIAFSILRDAGLAEDSAQDACATIARTLQTLKNPDVFRSWSYRIIVNQAITSARRRPQTEPLDATNECGVVFDRSDALDLYSALAALPVIQRGAILLRYYGGLNSKEIAAATGLPSSSVRFHLMLARRTLRRALAAGSRAAAGLSEEVLSDVR